MPTRVSRLQIGLCAIVAILFAFTMASPAFAAAGNAIPNTTPRFVRGAQNLGPADSSATITVTVRLQQHNKTTRDALLAQLYTKGSPSYHRFLSASEYAARFAPTQAEAAAVQDHLRANGLKILAVHPNNYYVTAQGRIADVQRAFGVQINRYSAGGKITYANGTDVTLPSSVAPFVSAVQGLHPVQMMPHLSWPINPDTGKPFAPIPLTSVQPRTIATTGQQYYESQCWPGVQSHAFENGTTVPQLPIALYSGNRYGGAITGGAGHYPPCGYEPNTIQTAYGLKTLYQNSLDGTGQTIAIVDAFGSPTAAADFGVFSSIFGLPTNNFSVVSPFGTPAYNSGWAGETTLDIEWAHSIAPGANILLVQSIDNYDNNLQNAIQWVLDNSSAHVISNSYGGDEYDDDAANMDAWDSLLAEAAMLGVSVDFSTGDSGDFYRAVGAYTVSVPSNSPHATAVGGTSDFMNADDSLKFQTGWGTNLTRIAAPGGLSAPNVPPVCASTLAPGQCFYYGAGGGESTYFAKPSWQSKLPGTGRWQPDVSMTADPYTGVEIVYSYANPGNYSLSVIGGTSASCPMFSAFWAIVDQAAGGSAGLAAPYLYSMPAGALRDVVPTSAYTKTDLTGNIMQAPPAAPLYESPSAIVGPDISTTFSSAFYQGTSTRWYAISFGTDSTLPVAVGWDEVTGNGTPNGINFVNGVLSQIPKTD